MKKEYISYLSAAIFILYALLSLKWIFFALGLILMIIGLADRFKSKP
ncbi:TPA: hypothetical protein TUU01_001846 [Streptococcus equi subsp. zooepidemicus]|uniref:Membrane protein n=1 Tax=Streptococcus equi subsp. zooepidemicus TaxID=40041 RepID=A0AAX2LGN9_STRSZ|nr:hypothetical protein [Streptococcus equi]KIS13774.1 membrane protein [Streptococcus equi subsp. zooepidemicus SzAM60]MCD3368314.1 hypothetical protein [Streptococcus equi subsp. zooepidemicus]MCD3396299.1 hypothetical protein [Streptococcus equi subsp. zooepidemicus]MCD3408222.1 hypothetical protein [Streptococcus equi subsp. zooepidemicus]MCD3427892.1 hypothetical protein [Streptococcus equi subsp. zooepidemicus]